MLLEMSQFVMMFYHIRHIRNKNTSLNTPGNKSVSSCVLQILLNDSRRKIPSDYTYFDFMPIDILVYKSCYMQF